MMPVSGVFAEDLPATESAEELSDVELAKKLPVSSASVSLVSRAWEALENGDLESVLKLTDECVSRYGKRAQQMQDKLGGYATGAAAEIRSHWAINDVATALFIQGKAFQNAEMYDEAKEAYKELSNKYKFGQCWDPRGWFWKPAEAAQENLAMIETGVFYDFGDYTSSTLVIKAWEALEKEDLDLVLGYTNKCISLYEDRARKMQSELSDYPQGDDDERFSYWALNDVATAHFIKGRALMIEGRNKEAAREFEIIRDNLSYGQCWDPRGWWWRPVVEADNWLKVFSEKEQSKG